MSHRTLLVLSVLLLVVGLIGIFFHSNEKQEVPTSIVPVMESERVIQVVRSKRDLEPHQLLSPEDYELSSIKIPGNTSDIREISNLSRGDMNGFLVRNYISKNTYLTAESIESPDSPTFLQHSLKNNEVPYDLVIESSDSYLFSILHSGDNVSLYLRYAKSTKGQKKEGPLIQEMAGNSLNNEIKNMDLIITDLAVLEVKRLDKNDSKEIDYRLGASAIGIVAVKVTSEQFAKLKLIEGSGDMILIPVDHDSKIATSIRLDEVLPHFRTIKELRGSK